DRLLRAVCRGRTSHDRVAVQALDPPIETLGERRVRAVELLTLGDERLTRELGEPKAMIAFDHLAVLVDGDGELAQIAERTQRLVQFGRCSPGVQPLLIGTLFGRTDFAAVAAGLTDRDLAVLPFVFGCAPCSARHGG